MYKIAIPSRRCSRWTVTVLACRNLELVRRMAFYGYPFRSGVLRENTYLSRTIEVQEGQKVIDTGLCGIVRHPMYSVTLLLFLSCR